MSLKQLEKIRQFERTSIATPIKAVAPRGARLLDIGAGTGWQAQYFVDEGYDVTAIDMSTSTYAHDRVFPITDYDGRTIPAPDATFDAVYSSNVLEHVGHADAFQREIMRVLKPGGIAVHIVPSGSWRTYSNVAHYPYILKRALVHARSGPEASHLSPSDTARLGTTKVETGVSRAGRLFRRALLPQRDGEVGNALTEIYHFSRWRWRRLFESNGWIIDSHTSNGLFYTGTYLLGTRLSIQARTKLSRLLGGSCHVFVLHPAPQSERRTGADAANG